METEYRDQSRGNQEDDPRWNDKEWASTRMRKIVQIAEESHPANFANYYALRKVSWLLLANAAGLFILHTTFQNVSMPSRE